MSTQVEGALRAVRTSMVALAILFMPGGLVYARGGGGGHGGGGHGGGGFHGGGASFRGGGGGFRSSGFRGGFSAPAFRGTSAFRPQTFRAPFAGPAVVRPPVVARNFNSVGPRVNNNFYYNRGYFGYRPYRYYGYRPYNRWYGYGYGYGYPGFYGSPCYYYWMRGLPCPYPPYYPSAYY
jgi:hypothetical protein